MISDERKVLLSTKTNEELIELAMLQQDNIKDLSDDYDFIKFLLLKEMTASGAVKMQHHAIEVTARLDKTTYNYSILAKLRELLDPSDNESFFTPAHDETKEVPEIYDMRVGKGFQKYGGEIKELLEEATIKGKIKEVILKRKE